MKVINKAPAGKLMWPYVPSNARAWAALHAVWPEGSWRYVGNKTGRCYFQNEANTSQYMSVAAPTWVAA